MTTKKLIPALLKSLTIVLSLCFFSACADYYGPNPGGAPSINVEFGEFSASTSTLELGESATLSWSVSDPDGAVDTITLTGGGIDSTKDLSGSQEVSPIETTTYYMTVLATDGQTFPKQLIITVLKDGVEILPGQGDENPVATEALCADLTDDDADGLIDCADSDCALAAECAPELPHAGSFIETPSFVLSSDDGLLCKGDSVVVSWISDFDSVSFSLSSGFRKSVDNGGVSKIFEEEVQITVENTVLTLTGKMISSQIDDVLVTLDIPTDTSGACDTPVFKGGLKVAAYPSNELIEGESYGLEWRTNNLSTLKLDGGLEALESTCADLSCEVLSAKSKTHTFKLTDTQTPAQTGEKSYSVKANAFVETPQELLSEGVTHVFPTEDVSSVLVFSGLKVFKATTNLSAFELVYDGSALVDHKGAALSGAHLTGYAALENGKIFVSTEKYLYLIEGETTTLLASFYRSDSSDEFYNFNFSFLLLVENEVMVGSNFALIKIDASGEPCAVYQDSILGKVCAYQINHLNGERTSGILEHLIPTANFRTVVKKYAGGSNKLFLLTSIGVFESTDGGASFPNTVLEDTGITGGSYKTNGAGYFWSESTLYTDEGVFGFTKDSGVTSVLTGSNIYFADNLGGRTLLSTQNGVYIKNALGWSKSASYSKPLIYITFEGLENYVSNPSGGGLSLNPVLKAETNLYNLKTTTLGLGLEGQTTKVSYKTDIMGLEAFNTGFFYKD